MTRTGLKSKLSYLIYKEKERREKETGDKVLIKDIEADIAEHCKLSPGTIKAYRKNHIAPSLAVSIKMAEYFNTTVEDLYQILDYDVAMGERSNAGRKPSKQKICKEEGCQRKVLARGLCSKHYQRAYYRNAIKSK